MVWTGESSTIGFKEYEAAARALKIPLQSLGVRAPNPDLDGAFQAAAKGRVNALVPIITPTYAVTKSRSSTLP